MAQKVTGYIKLQIPAAKATASPPVGPALGQYGVDVVAVAQHHAARGGPAPVAYVELRVVALVGDAAHHDGLALCAQLVGKHLCERC